MAIIDSKRVSDIKRAQKEKLLFKELSQFFWQLMMDDSRMRDLHISRVGLSPDKGICSIYFFSPHGASYFEEKLDILKLYKPSIRKAISQKIESRYTPELVFKYDESYEKQQRIEQLFDEIKKTEG